MMSSFCRQEGLAVGYLRRLTVGLYAKKIFSIRYMWWLQATKYVKDRPSTAGKTSKHIDFSFSSPHVCRISYCHNTLQLWSDADHFFVFWVSDRSRVPPHHVNCTVDTLTTQHYANCSTGTCTCVSFIKLKKSGKGLRISAQSCMFLCINEQLFLRGV